MILICIVTNPPCLNPYNMVNYGVSQLLTNVIKHKGITTTLTNCVTRCKHHFWSLCLWFWSALLPTLHVSTHTTWSIMVSHPLLTNVIKHKGITTNLQSVWPGANTPFAVCGLFLLCIFTTHPPPPSSLFYSTELTLLLPETGFRCSLLSTVIHCIKGGNYGQFFVVQQPCLRVKIYFLTKKS